MQLRWAGGCFGLECVWSWCVIRGSMKDFLERLVALKRAVLGVVLSKYNCLGTFSTDTTSQLDVFGHDGDTLGVDGAQVGVLEESDQVSFASLLESHDS